ncbi:flavodoxin [Saccharopolyspora sp. NPDC050389]|uniref:flavodoxin n=1 Tax=Saccharopolyspora sp. NPDC050389 TaxID=3155516 RepID=UPI003408A4E2
MPVSLNRRSLIRASAGLATAVLGGCSPALPRSTPDAENATTMPKPTETRTLLAYFSRAGENYYYGGRRTLTVGNTEALARMIGDRIDCEVYRIEAADPYPDGYDDTVARNVREQNADARPEITNPLPDMDKYEIVLLGSGIWNVRAPMIMSTFVESLDFTGKTILPFTTHAMSGLGTVERDYASSAPHATIGTGLAVRGEEVPDAASEAETWLREAGLLD